MKNNKVVWFKIRIVFIVVLAIFSTYLAFTEQVLIVHNFLDYISSTWSNFISECYIQIYSIGNPYINAMMIFIALLLFFSFLFYAIYGFIKQTKEDVTWIIKTFKKSKK